MEKRGVLPYRKLLLRLAQNRVEDLFGPRVELVGVDESHTEA